MVRFVLAFLFLITIIEVVNAGATWIESSYESKLDLASDGTAETFTKESASSPELKISGLLTQNLSRQKRAINSADDGVLTEDQFNGLVNQDGLDGKTKIQEALLKLVNHRDGLLSDPSKGRDKGSRSKQGEYVIHNSVLQLYKEIIDNFLKSIKLEVDPYGKPFINYFWRDLKKKSNESVRDNIKNVLKVKFLKAPAQKYIDTSTNIYEISVRLLKDLALKHMKDLYDLKPSNLKIRWTLPFEQAIDSIIGHDIFVDKEALVKWSLENPNDSRYNTTRAAFQTLFRNLKSKPGFWVSVAIRARNIFSRIESRRMFFPSYFPF